MSERELPSGIVAFFFSDIEGSTRMVHALGEAYAGVLDAHRAIVRRAFADHDGIEISTEGDSFFAVFAQASDAVLAAAQAQRDLATHAWDTTPVRIRIGIHVGEAQLHDSNYAGKAVHLAARVMSAAHGGQVLITKTCRDLAAGVLGGEIAVRDLGPHHFKDMPEAEQLFQLEHPDLESAFPPPRTRDARPNNLRAELTSFVGRESEVKEILDLVDSSRLLTVTGAGGAGKTRLALQVARALLDRFPDGVWFVDLAPVTEPEATVSAVALAIGVREQQDRSIEEGLLDAVRHRTQLIVLDNCEHLVASCADVAERLLQQCDELRILATSREPLGVPGERMWRIPSMPVPEPGMLSAVDALDHDAVRLFVDRAQQADPTFAVTDQNAPTIAEICRRLDGIPLAIELAAARVLVLSVDQIAERLHDRLRLLTGGSRTALSRQQTLRATVEWSYGLLSDGEQALLRRLSVFLGGFTLDAASAVFDDDALDGLSSLVAKSLVIVESERGSRFRLLETIRLHAREKLVESGEAESVHARHAEHFAAFAIAAAPHKPGPDQQTRLDRLEADYENLIAALTWLVEGPDPDRAVELAASLWRLWWVRGRWGEGLRHLNAALDAARQPSTPAAAWARWACAFLMLFRDPDGLEPLLEEAEAIQRACDDRHGLAYTRFVLGWVKDDAPVIREALGLARESGDAQIIAWCLLILGSQPGFLASGHVQQEAIEVARAAGDLWSVAMGLNNAGEIDYLLGDFDTGIPRVEEAVRIFAGLSDTFGLQESMRNITKASHLRGRRDDVDAWVDRARVTLRGSDGERYLPTILVWQAIDAASSGDAARAESLVDECAAQLTRFMRLQYLLTLLAYVKAGAGDLQGASAMLDKAEDGLSREAHDATAVVATLVHGLGGSRTQFLRGVPDALTHASQTDPWWIAPLLEQLAVFAAPDSPADAAQLLGAADSVRARHGGRALPAFAAQRDELTAAILADLGREAFDADRSRGATLTREAATDLAYSMVRARS